MADIVFHTTIQASHARVFAGCSLWSATVRPVCAVQIDQIVRAERDPLVVDRTPTPMLVHHAYAEVCQQQDAQIGAKSTCGAGLLRSGMMGVLKVHQDGYVSERLEVMLCQYRVVTHGYAKYVPSTDVDMDHAKYRSMFSCGRTFETPKA